MKKQPTKPLPKEPKFKLPKTPAACADLLYQVRQERLAAQKIVDKLQRQETQLTEYFINNLPKSDASGIAGKVARVQINGKTVAQVKDWPAFYKYIAKHDAFELLQRRVTQSAIDERWEAKEKVPGVEPYHVKTVSVTKL